jgi:hypothetical protein
VTLRDGGLESDVAENEIYRAGSVIKRGGPSACDRRLKRRKDSDSGVGAGCAGGVGCVAWLGGGGGGGVGMDVRV